MRVQFVRERITIGTKFFRIFEFAIREKKREKRKEGVVADFVYP